MASTDFIFGLFVLSRVCYANGGQDVPIIMYEETIPIPLNDEAVPQERITFNDVMKMFGDPDINMQSSFQGRYKAGVGPLLAKGLVKVNAGAKGSFNEGVKVEMKGAHIGRANVADILTLEGKQYAHLGAKLSSGKRVHSARKFISSLGRVTYDDVSANVDETTVNPTTIH